MYLITSVNTDRKELSGLMTIPVRSASFAVVVSCVEEMEVLICEIRNNIFHEIDKSIYHLIDLERHIMFHINVELFHLILTYESQGILHRVYV